MEVLFYNSKRGELQDFRACINVIYDLTLAEKPLRRKLFKLKH